VVLVAKYRKKPVVIEAVQYTGIRTSELGEFLNEATWEYGDDGSLRIATLNGVVTAGPFDYIVRGVEGEFYPCRADIFHATHEAVEDDG
jgi:hypothetical protein